MNIPDSNLPRIVIIGGGFGGLRLARALKGKPFQVVLLDKHNYHTFQPLLYQVATAGIEPDSIGYPLRKIFEGQKDFFFRLAEVQHINSAEKRIETTIGSLGYDKLVLATGSGTNFFGNKQLETNAMSMKSIPEALDIRSLLLQNFEQALLTKDLDERQALMNVLIVGAGPTGVELAGALSELRKHILPKDYPDLDVRRMEVHLIESAPKVLASMSNQSSEDALAGLEDLDVLVWLNTFVESYDGKKAITKDGKEFLAHTLIWAAGVKGETVAGIEPSMIVGGNRIAVNKFNEVIDMQGVFAIGDVAAMIDEQHPRGHAMVAQVAIQQGERLAKNFILESKGKEQVPFVYNDLGSMATIGRNKAVVDLPKKHFKGVFAWMVWLFVHIMQLVGFRNKLLVLMNWTYSYFRYARDTRLIIRPFKKKISDDIPQPS